MPPARSRLAPLSPVTGPLRRYLAPALVLSILVHLALLTVLNRPLRLSPPEPIMVSIELAPPPQARQAKQQIVSESQARPVERNDQASLLAEQASRVEREQLERGVSRNAGREKGNEQQPRAASPAPRAAPPAAVKKSAPAASSAPTLDHLTLDAKTVIEKFAAPAKPDPAQRVQQAVNGASPLNNYRAFSRPAGSGAAFIGTRGVSDHLPHLPDGDITLLNTKANQFAVFVRRVATQVFSELRASGWERMSAQDVLSINDYSEVRAVLSLEGKLLRVELLSSSGSARFDEVLRQAVTTGAKDPNPPAEAVANDGNIRFIFKSKSWVDAGGDPRRGGIYQRRWLLLGTGLE